MNKKEIVNYNRYNTLTYTSRFVNDHVLYC